MPSFRAKLCGDPESRGFHLDHCGRIPLLVKRGFQGEINSTAASRDLAKLIMPELHQAFDL